MAEHKIAIQNKVAIADTGIELVCNNPTDTIRFEFDDEWAGIAAKTARFSWEGRYIDVPFSGNVVEVPEIFQTNYVYVGVFGDNITSTPVKLKCKYSIKCLGGKIAAPAEDVYAQIIALINAGIDANDGVGVSTACVNDEGHLLITLTTGAIIDCGMVKGTDGKGVEEYVEMLESISALDLRTDALENYDERPFEVSGDSVQIENFEGMPIDVVTSLEPVQEGENDPTPENIRPITGWTKAQITRSAGDESDTYIADFGQSVCGGTYDWKSGILTIDRVMLTFDGSEGWSRVGGSNPYYVINLGALNSFSSDNMICSHFKQGTVSSSTAGDNICDVIHSSAYNKDRLAIRPAIDSVTSLDTFLEYLSAQYDAETPVQVVYTLVSLNTIQLTPQVIYALAGENSLYGDGKITVSGRKDILWLTSDLRERIKEIEKISWLSAIDTNTKDESGKTDMTDIILEKLNATGHCHLGEGVFYVRGNIDMPPNSTIEGCGDKTQIRLLSSVESGYVIRPSQYCTIKNLGLSGGYTTLNGFTAQIGSRHGIYFKANADGNEEAADDVYYSIVTDVFIRNFSGSGILLYNTGTNYEKCMYASNLVVRHCHTGINIDYYSEFNKFVNCLMSWCYYACVNNGGNNAFANCTFHGTSAGFVIDNSSGDKTNNAHGLCTGGTFCHSGSNTGSAITIKGTASGYVFTGCQIHYNSIDIENSYGIVFSGIQFGRGTTGQGAVININGGGTVMFNGCVFINDVEKPPVITITDNDNVKFNNCYGSHSGNAITG